MPIQGILTRLCVREFYNGGTPRGHPTFKGLIARHPGVTGVSSAYSVPLRFKAFGFAFAITGDHARSSCSNRNTPQRQPRDLLRDPSAEQTLRHPIKIHHHCLLIFHRQNLQLLRPVTHHLRVPVAPALSAHLRRLAASAVGVLVLTPRSPSCFLQQL